MEVLEKRIIYKSRNDTFHLWAIGDNHLGTLHCREKELEKAHNKIHNDPHALWVDMGDKCECITPSDPRWDAKVIAPWCKDNNIGYTQQKRYLEIVKKNADKCIGMIEGNHEIALRRRNHFDLHKNVCETLDVPDLGYTAFVRLVFSRGKEKQKTFTVMCVFTHGSGCATTKGAKLNRLSYFMRRFDADIYAHGHIHDVITDNIPYLWLDRFNRIKHKAKCGATTGCYFSTYTQGVSSSYGEQKGYDPTVLGSAVFTIKPSEGLIDVEKYLVA